MTIRVARPEVLDRIDPTRHAVIEASAGTGKTYALEHLVVELVLAHGVPLEQILVVTFTDKATREMRERVRHKLKAILDTRESSVGDGGSWTIDEEARRRLSDALAVFDRAPISTIHAFCQRVLSENAFDCARLLRQEQVESRDVFGHAFREELRVELAEGAPARPILERALSAWGVERLEASLYRWYLERGEPEPRFDREKAQHALERLPDRLELAPNGLAARVLSQSFSHPSPKKEVPARLAELAPTVEALRGGASIYEVLLAFWDWAQRDARSGKNNLSYLRHHLAQGAKKTPTLGPLAERIERLARVAGSPLTVLVAELLPRIVARLSGRKSARGHFDFDDMLRMLRDALYADGGEMLVGELRRRYRVALVDEFQDTDRVQWDIFRRIFFDAPQRLIVIGDPKQAIYGFRNADVHTYHAARAEIVGSGGSVTPLTACYRSRAPLLRAMNAILEEGFFTGLNSYPHPVTCARPERTAHHRGRELAAVTVLHMIGRPELRADLVRHALGERIAEEIARLLGSTSIVDERSTRPLEPSDIHVLCRSRSEADGIGKALSAASIPHAFYKQEGLFQTEAARDVFVLLRAIEDSDERMRRLDAWLTPFFAVPLERVLACRDVPPEHPLVALLVHWRELAEAQRWAALFRSMLEDSGIVRRELFTGANERRLTDTQHIFEILLEETHEGRRSLPQLIGRLGAFIEGRELPIGESGNVHRLESDRKAVQILTMHKAKGLEAEIVFLVGGLSEPPDDRLSPHVFHDARGRRIAWIGEPTEPVRERLRRERQEEAERLLYVAMTRARSALYLPYFGPPPPGDPVRPDTSYELVPDPEPEHEEKAQLSLFFEDPDARADQNEESAYELPRMSGPYRVLNDRLVALVGSELIAREEVPVTRRAQKKRADHAWRAVKPPKIAPVVQPDAERFVRLARAHAGFDITSYTRMKRGAHKEVLQPEDEAIDQALDAALPSLTDDELPSGAAVGVFLHEVLEELDFPSVRECESAAHLLANPDIRALFERCARRNGVDRSRIETAATLLIGALRAPLALADGARLENGLAGVDRIARELPFLHPIPERAHPTLADPPPGADSPLLTIERGYVRGIIDLVLEHQGRYHIVDYKSDRLPTYAPEALRLHIDRNYQVQARLYTLGTLRVLAIHDQAQYEARFGGLLYAFLRGMTLEHQGVWTHRPTWDEVLAWERALHEDTPWGHPLPPRRGRT